MKYAKGGITKGKSHKEGGIAMTVKSTGQDVELEGGEGVINKKAMSDTTKFDFEGKKLTKCEIASEINNDKNFGVSIDCNTVEGKKYLAKGGVVLSSYGGFGWSDKGNFQSEEEINKEVRRIWRSLSRKNKKNLADNNTKGYGVANLPMYKVKDKIIMPPKDNVGFNQTPTDKEIDDAINSKRYDEAYWRSKTYADGGSVKSELTFDDWQKTRKRDLLKAGGVVMAEQLIYPSDSLGIPRADMPQIRKAHYPEFLTELEIDGIGFEQKEVEASSLKPTQSYINPKRIDEITNATEYRADKPIVVSNDNYVIDGHHRWYYKKLNNEMIPAIVIDLPVLELIQRSREFDKVEYERFDKGGITRADYPSLFSDTDNDGVPNVDDKAPMNPEIAEYIEETSLSKEMGEVLDYRNKFDGVRKRFVKKLTKISDQCGIKDCEIISRTKTPYSIINKMRRRSLTDVKRLGNLEVKAKKKLKNQDLNALDLYKGLTDVVGTMVIAEDKASLDKLKTKVLKGAVGDVLEFEDFYKEPNNGYRAYHFIIGVKEKDLDNPKEKRIYPVEVQLRTARAKKLSDASHKVYKDGRLNPQGFSKLSKMILQADEGDRKSQLRIDTILEDKEKLLKSITSDKYAEGGVIEQLYRVEWDSGDGYESELFDSNELDIAKELYDQVKGDYFHYEKPKLLIERTTDGEIIKGEKFEKGGKIFAQITQMGGKEVHLTDVFDDTKDSKWDDVAQAQIDWNKSNGKVAGVVHRGNLHGLYMERGGFERGGGVPNKKRWVKSLRQSFPTIRETQAQNLYDKNFKTDTSFMQNLKKKYAEGGKIDTSTVAKYLGANQTMPDEEVAESLSKRLAETPSLGGQDGMDLNAVIYLHYFNPSSDWYVTEIDKTTGEMFGYAILDGNRDYSSLGYFTLSDLQDMEGVNPMSVPELDYYWKLKTLNETFRDKGYTDLIEGKIEMYKETTSAVEVEVVETSNILDHKFANDFERNLAIRELVDEKGDSGNNYSIEEKEFLSTYSGMGGLEKYGAEGIGLLYEYYTPKDVAKKMWGLAFKHRKNIEFKNALEPSCGVGGFIAVAPSDIRIEGVDIDKYAISICKVLYQSRTIKFYQESFEKRFISPTSESIKGKLKGITKYDIVIGNPPYGKYRSRYSGMGERTYTHAQDFIDYFILRGLDVLNKNGLLIFIIGAVTKVGATPFLDKKTSYTKSMIMERAELVEAYRLGIGVFGTTEVDSDIIVLRKK